MAAYHMLHIPPTKALISQPLKKTHKMDKQYKHDLQSHGQGHIKNGLPLQQV